MLLRGVVATSVLCLTLTISGEPRPPWRWTATERSEALLDPAQRAARARAYEASRARRENRAPAPVAPAGDVIDGNTNPELFFPTELFRTLVTSAFIELPQVYDRVVAQRSSDLFHQPGEWEYFRSVTTELTTLLGRGVEIEKRRVRAPAAERARLDTELADVRRSQCTAMAAALRTLRTRFGAERFDRMLYEVVPPGRLVAFSDSSGKDLHGRLKRILAEEKDCQ